MTPGTGTWQEAMMLVGGKPEELLQHGVGQNRFPPDLRQAQAFRPAPDAVLVCLGDLWATIH